MTHAQWAKIVTGAFLLVSLGAIILISKKPILLVERPLPQFPAPRQIYNPFFRNANSFGSTITAKSSDIPGAIVEQVKLSVPRDAQSDEKIIRYGRLVRYPTARATILICHGFMCDKYDVGFLRNMFKPGTFNFMTFDFRAHGENCQGQRCTFGRDEALDVITAAHFIKNYEPIKNIPLIVYGFSMGSVASIEAQARDSSLFKAMILDCPFDSSENIIKRNLESIQFTFFGYDFSMPACALLQQYAFHPYVQSLIKGILKTVSNLDVKNIELRIYPVNPVESIKKVTVPCFFIHCKNDEKVSVEAVKSVYNACGASCKLLWLTNGRRHFDSYFYNPERYVREIDTFINRVLDNKLDDSYCNKIYEDPEEVEIAKEG